MPMNIIENTVCCIHWLCEILFNLISDLDSRILFWVLFAESSQPPLMSTRDGDCSGSQNISATPWRKTLAWSREVATYQNTEITTVYHRSCFLLHIFPSLFLSFSSSILQREGERERGGGRERGTAKVRILRRNIETAKIKKRMVEVRNK